MAGDACPISQPFAGKENQMNMKFALNEICVNAVNEMVHEGIEKHVQFISAEDKILFGLKEGGKIPKVTIEWVDASEADPENFEAG
jgi:hypothetical protein